MLTVQEIYGSIFLVQESYTMTRGEFYVVL